MARSVLLPVSCLVVVLGGAVAAHAEEGAAAGLSLEQAVERVQRDLHARVVKAETVHEHDETLYRLRLLAPDGHVSTVTVHAADGRVE